MFEARFRLGMFDPPEKVPFARIPMSENDTPEHEALALRVARESIVLLKNDGVLPLNRAKIKRIAVIGANADSVPMLLGNYNGTPARPVTILNGIEKIAGAISEVTYAHGEKIYGTFKAEAFRRLSLPPTVVSFRPPYIPHFLDRIGHLRSTGSVRPYRSSAS